MEITDDDLEGLTTWTLIRAAHASERTLTALFAGAGLSPVQFGVLANLAAAPSCTQAELARRVLVRPQTIAGVLDGMVARGLVLRSGPRTRGRRNPVTLGPLGRDLLDAVWPEVLAANAGPALGLRAPDLTVLNRLLHTVLERQETTPSKD